ncbi:tumor necrosis factor receptor superfamily member 14-like, partial [Engraulis encrasicolus]|uniref:tumor necrosis factor receptor superfamily member 14-like n=1 Tax=Engraulis encrasicolus TaxID=184585 RepID=UPI002FD4604B
MSLLHTVSNTTIFKIIGLRAEEDMLKFLIAALILLLAVCEVSCACGRAEYLIGQECCPMCGPGYYVRRHCTEYTSTTCVPCSQGSYTDAPNGLEACRSCRVCDSRLRLKRACTPSSDALCEPLEGHYCTDPTKDGCQGAVRHTECLSGQYIKRPGSDILDAECDDCVGKEYSDGSFTSCRPHTRCEEKGLIVLAEGSISQDT